MIKILLNFIKSIYSIYLYKIVKYYDPIIEKKTLNNYKINKYNVFNTNNKEYIYKCLNVKYNDNIYYNLGTYFHVSNENLNIIINKELISLEDDIDLIKIKLLSKDNNEYTIIDENFINSILIFSTKQSRLEPLLYYYLQTYLFNYDKIIDIEFEINNKYNKVDINILLENL